MNLVQLARPSGHKTSLLSSNYRLLLILFLVGIFVALSLIQQVEATVFLLGEACLIGIGLALDLAERQLERLGIEDSIEIIRSFCHGMVRYSPEVVVTESIEAALREMVRFIARTGVNLPNHLDGLSDRVTNLANEIELSFEMNVNS